MERGRVKFFIQDRGFGFLTTDPGNVDVFVHVKEIHKTGLRKLTEGQTVQFEIAPGRDGKPKAVKVELVP